MGEKKDGHLRLTREGKKSALSDLPPPPQKTVLSENMADFCLITVHLIFPNKTVWQCSTAI